MGYSGRIFAVGVKNAVYLCPSTTVPYIEFDREDKEQQCNKPSGECTLVHSSIREGHSMFPTGRSSTAVRYKVFVQLFVTAILSNVPRASTAREGS